MHQLLQDLRTGSTILANIPVPSAGDGEVLIATQRSLVSAGTEKMLVQFAKASLLKKARLQPEKVRQVLAKIKTDGLVPTIEAVFRKLDEPMPLGYSNMGVVIGVGNGVQKFTVGDRVASNGPHAEVASIPSNLCAIVPEGVSNDAAAFTVISAIGLEGIRLARPELGETVVVIGLGLIGQITIQLLRASGCRVIGFDLDQTKVALARKFGAIGVASGGDLDPVLFVAEATGGLGADAVFITATTSSNEVISHAAKMARKRGRIVLVGVVGMQLNRADLREGIDVSSVMLVWPWTIRRNIRGEGIRLPAGLYPLDRKSKLPGGARSHAVGKPQSRAVNYAPCAARGISRNLRRHG
jgi:threonine dehydrogenase-like Zn-dependent dehydrogenase